MTTPSADGRPVPALADREALAEALHRFTPHVSTLSVVVDDSPSMEVWTPTVHAFQNLAASVFDTVDIQFLGSFREPRGRAITPAQGRGGVSFCRRIGGMWRVNPCSSYPRRCR